MDSNSQGKKRSDHSIETILRPSGKEQNDEFESVSGPCKRSRRSRTLFPKETVAKLEHLFKLDQYPGIFERETIGRMLDIPESRVQVWFQNRRSRKRKYACTEDTEVTYANRLHRQQFMRNYKGTVQETAARRYTCSAQPPASFPNNELLLPGWELSPHTPYGYHTFPVYRFPALYHYDMIS